MDLSPSVRSTWMAKGHFKTAVSFRLWLWSSHTGNLFNPISFSNLLRNLGNISFPKILIYFLFLSVAACCFNVQLHKWILKAARTFTSSEEIFFTSQITENWEMQWWNFCCFRPLYLWVHQNNLRICRYSLSYEGS